MHFWLGNLFKEGKEKLKACCSKKPHLGVSGDKARRKMNYPGIKKALLQNKWAWHSFDLCGYGERFQKIVVSTTKAQISDGTQGENEVLRLIDFALALVRYYFN